MGYTWFKSTVVLKAKRHFNDDPRAFYALVRRFSDKEVV